MRISTCAELAGTTVRTIRYYHQIGILPVPETVNGIRDYQVSHLARILRIRWLAESGLSLDTIASLLEEEQNNQQVSSSALSEIDNAVASLDLRMQQLTDQRQRLLQLKEQVATGNGLDAVPQGLQQFYQQVILRLQDPDAIRAVHREHHLVDLFLQRGLVTTPQELAAITNNLTDHDVDRVVEFYTYFAQLPKLADQQAETVVQYLDELVISWTVANPDLVVSTLHMIPDWAFSSMGIRVVKGLMRLQTRGKYQAELLDRLTERFFRPRFKDADTLLRTFKNLRIEEENDHD